MPVIPEGVEPFEILPPVTQDDDGRPSNNLLDDAQRVFHLIQDERHLTADDLLTSVQERVDEATRLAAQLLTHNNHGFKSLFHSKAARNAKVARERAQIEIAQVQELLKAKAAIIEKLKNRCRLFRKAQQNLNENEEWTLGSSHFGIKTYYRREPDQSLSIKLEGEIEDAPLFEQICVLKEFGLHCKWAPFCFSSQTIADVDKLDTIGWFMLGLPSFGIARDGCIRAIGCDNTLEDGSVILAGQGVCDVKPGKPDHADGFLSNDPILHVLDMPPVPKGRGTGRITIRTFEAVIHLVSPNSAKTKVVTNLDPNVSFLPSSLLEFVMKHLAGVVLSKLQVAAQKITQNPKENPHAMRMRQDRDFYESWLLPKCQRLCESKGWIMTPVPYFTIVESQDEQEILPSSVTPASHSTTRAASVDDMSEISNDSSILSRNPITQYLKKVERKTQQRKAEYIAQFRKRAAERLAPSEFATTASNRLSQLQQAKAKRRDAPPSLGLNGQPASSKFFDQLKLHGPYTRMIILMSLVFLLFLALHPNHFVHSLSIVFDPEGPWSSLILLEVGMVLYLFFCAMLHYLVCGVALVYAFDTLEVGSKSGKGIRDFYSENVVYGVLMCSLGIIAVSGVAASSVWISVVPWSIVSIVRWSSNKIDSVLVVAAKALPTTAAKLLIAVAAFFRSILSIIVSCVTCVSKYFAGGHNFIAAFAGSWNIFSRSIVDSAASFDCKQSMVNWGNDAFSFARILYLSSAAFLVYYVTLFPLFMERGTHVKKAFDALLLDDET